jgi:predicted DNA-binding transcriptional regulator YafY
VDESSPTARALLCLQVLQDCPGITADRLGEKLGVSERAARRYVGLLREAGIPIESARGPYGGYRVGRGLRLPPLVFTATEALGLVMAVLDGHHVASDPGEPVGSALGKIIRAMPQPVAAQAEAVRRTTAPAPDRAAARPDPATTSVLVQACSTGHRVRLDYRSEAGSQWSVEVEPWAVVVRHGRWYLLCRSLAADALRAYRVDRVRAVDLLPETSTAPTGLDPVALLEQHLAVGWEHDVEVVIDAPVDEARGSVPPALGRRERVDERTSRLVGSTSNPTCYAAQLASVPHTFKVVGGPAVEAAVRSLAQRLRKASTRSRSSAAASGS